MKIQCSNCNLFFEVDDEDTQKVLDHNTRWCALFKFRVSKRKCVITQINCRSYITKDVIALSHIILGKPPEEMVIDHIDRNPLNNKKRNLRFVTKSQSMMNRNKYSHTKKYKNVFRSVSGHCWKYRIIVDGKEYCETGFPLEEMAAEAVNEKMKELHGEFAVLNRLNGEIK